MNKSERTLTSWGLVASKGQGPYLAGHSNGLMRISTALVSFNPDEGVGITASGRPYRLSGPADPIYALECAYTLWGRLYDLKGSDIKVIEPDEAVAMIQRLGNAPLDKGPEEAASEREIRLRLAGADIRRQVVLSGMDDKEAAAVAGMPLERFASLVSGSEAPDDLTVDEAESALSRIVAHASRGFPVGL